MLSMLRAATIGLGLATATSTAVYAQSSCGEWWDVKSGDTLYEISQQCDISIAEIVNANPRVTHPSRIGVGWTLDITPDEGPDPASRASQRDLSVPDGAYRVKQGDTLAKIADRKDVPLSALINVNPGINPNVIFPGDVLQLPEQGQQHAGMTPSASVTPGAGPSGHWVTVEAEGFRPGEQIDIGVGKPEAEYKVVKTARADTEGDLSVEIHTPDWAQPNDGLIFVAVGADGRKARTGQFDIAHYRPVDPQPGDRIEIDGVVRNGVECPVITTQDGAIFSLAASGDYNVRTGVKAHLEGRIAEVSFCQQGEGTITITEFRPMA